MCVRTYKKIVDGKVVEQSIRTSIYPTNQPSSAQSIFALTRARARKQSQTHCAILNFYLPCVRTYIHPAELRRQKSLERAYVLVPLALHLHQTVVPSQLGAFTLKEGSVRLKDLLLRLLLLRRTPTCCTYEHAGRQAGWCSLTCRL